jgi:hypothetical protein
MEFPQNTEITVPGGTTFGYHDTNLHASMIVLRGFSSAARSCTGPGHKAHRSAAYLLDRKARCELIGGNHPKGRIPRRSAIVYRVHVATGRGGLLSFWEGARFHLLGLQTGPGVMRHHCEEFYLPEISIRFLPNRRASTDHAPGPIIASAAPKAPSLTCIHGSLQCDRTRHSSATAISTPATGVHKPTSNSVAEPAATSCRMSGVFRDAVSSPSITC